MKISESGGSVSDEAAKAHRNKANGVKASKMAGAGGGAAQHWRHGGETQSASGDGNSSSNGSVVINSANSENKQHQHYRSDSKRHGVAWLAIAAS